MKRLAFTALAIIAALACVACIAATASIAGAAPLTAASNGHYYDPAQSGQSLQLYVLPNNDVFGYVQLGVVPGYTQQPTWYSVQGAQVPDGAGVTIALYDVQSVMFGAALTPSLIRYGEVHLVAIDDNTIDAVITIDARGELFFSPFLPPPPLSRAFAFRKLLR